MTDIQPTKDDHALVELLDVLLEEGAVIRADVVITVADIPLVGISLRAAIAGMATMSEYGMFGELDVERSGSQSRIENRETSYRRS